VVSHSIHLFTYVFTFVCLIGRTAKVRKLRINKQFELFIIHKGLDTALGDISTKETTIIFGSESRSHSPHEVPPPTLSLHHGSTCNEFEIPLLSSDGIETGTRRNGGYDGGHAPPNDRNGL
jgi:hypothetical protein